MVSGARYGLFGALITLLAACASPQPKVALDDQSAQQIQTISIVRPPKEFRLAVLNLGHPGMAFGLIGGAIAAADEQDKTKRLTDAMIAQTFSPSDVLVAALERDLTAVGYKVEIADGAWGPKEKADTPFSTTSFQRTRSSWL